MNLKNIWARNQNSNKNEFWFYENEFKYINKKEMEWNSFHYSIVATSKYTLNLYGGLLLSLVQTRLKGPLDQQKLGPKSFGPMGPLYFYVFNRVKAIINWVPPWGSDLGFTAVKMSLGFLFSLFKFWNPEVDRWGLLEAAKTYQFPLSPSTGFI